MSKLSPDSILNRCRDVRFRRVLDEAVVIRQEAAESMVINETAASVLEYCDGQRNLQQICQELQNIYEVEATTLTEDILQFAQELEAAGLVERVS